MYFSRIWPKISLIVWIETAWSFDWSVRNWWWGFLWQTVYHGFKRHTDHHTRHTTWGRFRMRFYFCNPNHMWLTDFQCWLLIRFVPQLTVIRVIEMDWIDGELPEDQVWWDVAREIQQEFTYANLLNTLWAIAMIGSVLWWIVLSFDFIDHHLCLLYTHRNPTWFPHLAHSCSIPIHFNQSQRQG